MAKVWVLLLILATLYLSVNLAQQAPASFLLTFNTTVKVSDGLIVINVTRAWSPHGADRLWQLLNASVNYYAENGFFRVVTGFVVQFGISGIPALSQKYETAYIPDDPVILSNVEGTVAYADAGNNTRTTQLFINYANNTFLDSEGFTPVGMIIKGMDVALGINAQYSQEPDQTTIYSEGNAYLKRRFPNLDYITTATAST